MRQTEPLTITQTPTGYWSVKRGPTHLAGAVTRKGAEAEREMLSRLGSHPRPAHPASRLPAARARSG